MNQEIITKCYNKFELRERRGQGIQMFKYINSKDIIHRMNTIFAGNWSSEVLQTETIDNQVLVRVRVCITDPETGKMYITMKVLVAARSLDIQAAERRKDYRHWKCI